MKRAVMILKGMLLCGLFSLGAMEPQRPLTCALDEPLFKDLHGQLDALIEAATVSADKSPLLNVCMLLKKQLSDDAMVRHRTILIAPDAARFIVKIEGFSYLSGDDSAKELSLEQYRDSLIEQWDSASDAALIQAITERSSLQFPESCSDFACFIELNKKCAEKTLVAPLTAAFLGRYYLRQLNRNKARYLYKSRLNATKSEFLSYTKFDSCP